MRLLAVLMPQAVVPPVFTVDGIIQGGALALLGFVLFYGMKFGIPQIVDAMRDTQEQVRLNTRVLARLAAIILQHDATVRGVNPETIGSTEDLMRRVLDESGAGS